MGQVNEKDTKKKLAGCPCCGGEAEFRECYVYLDNAIIVKCKECGLRTAPVLIDHPKMSGALRGPDESTRLTKEQAEEAAAERWNRRV